MPLFVEQVLFCSHPCNTTSPPTDFFQWFFHSDTNGICTSLKAVSHFTWVRVHLFLTALWSFRDTSLFISVPTCVLNTCLPKEYMKEWQQCAFRHRGLQPWLIGDNSTSFPAHPGSCQDLLIFLYDASHILSHCKGYHPWAFYLFTSELLKYSPNWLSGPKLC